MTHKMDNDDHDGYCLFAAFVCRTFLTVTTHLFSNKYNDLSFVFVETILLKTLHYSCTVCGHLCYGMYL